MADKKISALTALAQGDVVVSTDVLPIVDTSATETKKIAVNALVGAAAAAGLTNVDINSGTIDGTTIATSDITVGSGKTLNVSAGTLSLADNQISGDKVEGGTINAITINTLTSTAVNATTVDATNVEVTNIKAKDGTAAATIADSTGIVSLSANPTLSGGTANGVLYLNGSKVATSGSALTFDGNGAVISVNSSSDALRITQVGSGNALVVEDSANPDATPTVITATGNVGIGTTSPAYKLDVSGTINSGASNATGYNLVFRTSGITTGRVQTGLTNTSGDLYTGIEGSTAGQTLSGSAAYSAFVGTFTANPLYLVTNGSIRTTLDTSGNLGIGTSSPSYRLSVEQSASAVIGANIRNVNTGSSAYAGIYFGGTASATDVFIGAVGDSNTAFGGGRSAVFGTNTTTPIAFTTNGTEKMRLDSSGNLGIGTSSPANPLHVVSSANTIIAARNSGAAIGQIITGNTAGDVTIRALASGDGLIYSDTSKYLAFGSGGSTERMRITAEGRLAVGQATILGTSNRATFANDQSAKGVISIGNSSTSGYGAIELYDNAGAQQGAMGWGNASVAVTGAASAVYMYSTGPITFLSGGTTERARFTAAGELLVGGTTAISSASGAVTIQQLNANAILNLYRNDTTISAGNNFGTIAFYGNDTTGNTPVAHALIEAYASETHAAGDNPTDITFATTPDGTAVAAEAGRITQAGSYVLKGGTTTAAAGVGIIFPATQVASANANSLDDYEEGTWTPAWAFSTSGSVTLSGATGTYTKIGNTVTIHCYVNTSAISSPTGDASITGLPFTAAAGSGVAFGLVRRFASDFTTTLKGECTSVVTFYTSNSSAVNATQLQGSDFSSGVNYNQMRFTATYIV